MWAHYADSHKGIAIRFDVPDNLLFKIDYVESRITPEADVDHSKAAMVGLVVKLLRTKHKEWSYEDEYRLVRRLENCNQKDDEFFAALNDKTRLEEVILGARYQGCQCEKLESDLKSAGVKYRTVRAELKGFRMTT